MRLEPPFDLARLRACVAAEYGVPLSSLTYIPQGEASFSYVAEAVTGRRYILKVLDGSRLGRAAAERLVHAIPLMTNIRSSGVLLNVPQPVYTRSGRALAACGDVDVALTVYVPGRNPERAILHRPDVWGGLAADVGRLHGLAGGLTSPGLETEDYSVPFEAVLLEGMLALERLTAESPPGHRALADLLVDKQGRLMALLARLHGAAVAAHDLASPHTLCHTDIHEMNLLTNAAGELTILDWEGAKWAPAEHDLFAFTGDDFPAFLEAYLDAGGVRELHAETFEFYFLRRNLEDLTDYIVRILYEDDDEQAEMDVAAAASECLAGWPYIEPGVARVRGQLRSIHTTSRGVTPNG